MDLLIKLMILTAGIIVVMIFVLFYKELTLPSCIEYEKKETCSTYLMPVGKSFVPMRSCHKECLKRERK